MLQSIKINKTYVELIKRFTTIDNYEKMKAVLDIGESGLKVIENVHNHSKETDFSNSEEINNYLTEINELKKTHQLLESNNIELQKYHNQDIISLRKELDENYLNQISQSKIIIDNLNNDMFKLKHESFEKLSRTIEERDIKFFNEINKIKQDKKHEIDYFKELLNKNQEENKFKLDNEIEKMKNETDEIVEKYKQENMRYREKYEQLELKSVKKGIPYEDAIERELNQYLENNNNIYKLERFSTQKGKGDFLVTNNYTNIRIMLEAKNMPSVSSTIKDQLPKFYDNINDTINLYDGGIMIASNNIEKKKNYEIETLPNNKVVCFIENYNLNMTERIYCIIEILHNKIQDLKAEKDISRVQVLDNQVELYKTSKDSYNKIKIACDKQLEMMMSIKENILNLFSLDVETYILSLNNTNKSQKENITETIETYIKTCLHQEPNLKEREIKEKIYIKFKSYIELYDKDKKNGISKRAISNIVKKISTFEHLK
jgi:hypothetical protein